MKNYDKKPEIILSEIKLKLTNAVIDRKHSFHTPVFSNITIDNKISSRIVVLRKYNPQKNILNFHTDIRSKKIIEIRKNPETYFVFYSYKDKIQLRINTISKIHHQNNISKKNWEKTKLSSRKCYLAIKSPSSISKIATDSIPENFLGKDPELKESEKGYKNFSVIENEIKDIEWLYLSANGHRRLIISNINKNVKYNWLIP
tara:strand:+ start:1287 stop:1892 length:606 start_codon:yes stop_codon:yes gene_type:complete